MKVVNKRLKFVYYVSAKRYEATWKHYDMGDEVFMTVKIHTFLFLTKIPCSLKVCTNDL
jgi:hypothetical protein